MRIGIPRALLYYYYYPVWVTMFKELGFEIVISDDTNKKMIDEGIKVTVQEICVPIKIFNSHVLDLIKNGVDYIFIPRMVSIKKYETFCPKFLGLPDMAKVIFKDYGDRILSPKILNKNENITNFSSYKGITSKLGIAPSKMKGALRAADREFEKYRSLSQKGFTLDEILNGKTSDEPFKNTSPDAVNIGVLGYVYNIYDSFISMDIISKFRSLGANIVTFDMLSEKDIYKHMEHLKKQLFWTFSNKLLGAGLYFLNEDRFDGIVHITAFGCGPDSYIGKMMELDSEKKHKPFLTIRVDEHTGDSHLVTRVEAFTDMLKRRKMPQFGRVSV
ncbi:acyl-CoA dehydratase activase-related protein [Pseudobacteroides cellulosolvens]|uniref:DUF2229 domain-containing protein n=1 Tax=Pseudobacteroides cellulosolvens ATCC 35603 = DSM 2933 TaxID=398512 RepID=A0A0L6JQX3_9FIRM|nr:acyl-CoA dehydratase activase-related protein [Pseudobacteroides cellulosolvens]KNY28105.1 Protein of unknown function DUF2229, CoA enzyme activase [Pseudobacteroides cellulosolvens ATCC 35603 = DSM 2933]